MVRKPSEAAAVQGVAARLAPFQVSAPTANFDLAAFDPAAKPFSFGAKTRDREAVDTLAVELDALQNIFYADRRRKLLVVEISTKRERAFLNPSFLSGSPVTEIG